MNMVILGIGWDGRSKNMIKSNVMKAKRLNTYPWSYFESDEESESIVERLHDLLPHGSGIDYPWNIIQQKTNKNRFECHCGYHAMTEHGFYCHTYDFKVVYNYNPITERFTFVRFSFHGQKEYTCCGYGLIDYLNDTLYDIHAWEDYQKEQENK